MHLWLNVHCVSVISSFIVIYMEHGKKVYNDTRSKKKLFIEQTLIVAAFVAVTVVLMLVSIFLLDLF